MLKLIRSKGKNVKAKVTALMMALSIMAIMAVPVSANSDLDTITSELIDGADSMKTNGLLIIGVCITIFVIVFGIGWLMSIFKKKMSKAG